MSTHSARGTLTLSVDLEHDHIRVGIAEQRALGTMADQLTELFDRHKLPAAWAVTDPALSAIRTGIDITEGGHELALLGDASWVGREAGRRRFARELARRVARAQSDGLTLHTLALRTDLPGDHSDLAIKEGIVAVRDAVSMGVRASRRLKPQSLRFGLWGFPVTVLLPGTSRWLPGGGGLCAARFEIDRAITEQGLVHVAFDAPRLAERGGAALRIVERLLRYAAQRREQGLLDVNTIGAIAGKLSHENQGQPSRSILRPAA